jgi:hypothetical protein
LRHAPIHPQELETRAHDAFHAPYFVPSLIAIALASTLPPAESRAFERQGHLNLRNFYINRNFTNPTKAQGKAEGGRRVSSSMPNPGSPRAPSASAWMCWGCTRSNSTAAKAPVARSCCRWTTMAARRTTSPHQRGVQGQAVETELKVGEWMPVLPILRSDDGRSLPQTFRGGQITSKEIDGLTLYGGQFREQPATTAAWRHVDDRQSGVHLRPIQLPGGEYSSTTNAPRSVWNAELKDIYSQQYST